MTLQVGLVGTDGIVLASDKKAVVFDPALCTSLVSKILIDREKGLAGCCAGNEISARIRREIFSNSNLLQREYPQSPIEELATQIYRDIPTEEQAGGNPSDLLIVSLNDLRHLYHLRMSATQCTLRLKENKHIQGDLGNPARLFVEAYYSKKPIHGLVFLAAHTILTANRLNPTTVEGLEVVKCTTKNFEPVSESELQVLVVRSQKTAEQTERSIFRGPFLLNWNRE
jgi:hypothetical protein